MKHSLLSMNWSCAVLLLLSVTILIALGSASASADENLVWSNETDFGPISDGGCACMSRLCDRGEIYGGGCCYCYAWPPDSARDCYTWISKWKIHWPLLDPETREWYLEPLFFARPIRSTVKLDRTSITRIKQTSDYRQAMTICRQWIPNWALLFSGEWTGLKMMYW